MIVAKKKTTLRPPTTVAARLLASFLEPLGLEACWIGHGCYVPLPEHREVRIDWHSANNHHEHYNALLLRVLDKHDGEIDRKVLRFADYFRPKNPRWQGPAAGFCKCEVLAYCGWDWYGPKGTDQGHPDNPASFLAEVAAYIQLWE